MPTPDPTDDTETPGTQPASPLLRSGLAAACCLLLVAGALTGAVTAHTELAGTSPEDGEQLQEPPSEVVLAFDGEEVQVADVTVTGPDDEAVGGEAAVGEDAESVTVPVEPAGEGVYTVRWEILAEDGHTTGGAFFFVVGEEELDREQVLSVHDDGGGDAGGGPPVGEALVKGLLLAALLVLLGAPVTVAAVAPTVNRSGVDSPTGARRGRLVVGVAAAALLLAVTLLGLLRVAAIAGSPARSFGTFVATSVGRAWLLQVALAGVTLGAVAWGQRSDEQGLALAAAFLGALGVAVLVGWTSHSAALVDRAPGVAVAVAHLAGAALWVGGLVVLGALVPPYLRAADEGTGRDLAAGVAETYSVLAVAGVAVAASTGLVLLSWHVPDANSLLATAYGRLLTAKLALVAVALGFGGFNRFLLLRALRGESPSRPFAGLDSVSRALTDGGPRAAGEGPVARFVRSVRLEGGVLLAVVLLSGALTSAPTAAAVAAGGGDAVQRAQVGDVEVAFEPVPSTPTDGGAAVDAGQPVVYDVTFSVGGGPPDDVEEVGLTLEEADGDASMELAPEAVGGGTYSVVHTVPSAGTWTLQVDAFVDGVYVSEAFDMRVDERDASASDAESAEESDASDGGSFAFLARIAALAVGLVGTVAVTLEARRDRSRADRNARDRGR